MRAVVILVLAAGCGFPGAMGSADDDTPTDDTSTDDTSTDDTSTDEGPPIDAAEQPASDWWSAEYRFRAPIVITAGGTLVAGYSVALVVNTKVLVDANHAEPSGRDWRILRRSVVEGVVMWTELDRWVEDVPARSFNKPETRTWFRLPAALAAGATDSDTYVYYGASPGVPQPPRDLNRVFLFADDFETDLAKWTKNNLGEDVKVVNEHAAGAKSLEFNGGATSAAGLHADIELPATPIVFSRHVRQAQTNASFGEARGFDKPYALRTKTWVEANLRLATELDTTDQMQVWAANNVLNNWFKPVGTNTWHHFDAVYDSVANTVRCRADDNPMLAPIDIRYTQGTPIRSIALEGEGQGGRFWLDNFIIRHWASPEPSAALGPEEAQP